MSEAIRQYGLWSSEVEQWVNDGKQGIEIVLQANPQDVREQHEHQLKDLQGMGRGVGRLLKNYARLRATARG